MPFAPSGRYKDGSVCLRLLLDKPAISNGAQHVTALQRRKFAV